MSRYSDGLDAICVGWDYGSMVSDFGTGVANIAAMFSPQKQADQKRAAEEAVRRQVEQSRRSGEPEIDVQQAIRHAAAVMQQAEAQRRAEERQKAEEDRRRAEERSRFWGSLVAGVALAGFGFAVWRFSGQRRPASAHTATQPPALPAGGTT